MLLGSTVAQQVVYMPQKKKVAGLIPTSVRTCLCVVCIAINIPLSETHSKLKCLRYFNLIHIHIRGGAHRASWFVRFSCGIAPACGRWPSCWGAVPPFGLIFRCPLGFQLTFCQGVNHPSACSPTCISLVVSPVS